jgi:uncharacterized protein (TIGR00297 family)
MGLALLEGFGLAAAIGVLAWRMRALDLSGAITAVIVGTIIFGLGGLHASAILIAFFVTGSVLSALPGGGKVLTGDEKHGRSWEQVAANGAIPAAAILLSHIPRFQIIGALAFVGSVVAATADSWSTELGTRYGGNPIDSLSGDAVVRGMSGGISGVGLLGSLTGSALIATIAVLPIAGIVIGGSIWTFAAIIVAGLTGTLADSIFGSSVQAKFQCEGCGVDTELRTHCNRPAKLVLGYKNITNNSVNFAASAISAIILFLLLD